MSGCSATFSSGSSVANSEVESRFGQFWQLANATLSSIDGIVGELGEYVSGWEQMDVPEYTVPSLDTISDPGDVDIADIADLSMPSGITSIGWTDIHQPVVGAVPENDAVVPTLYYPSYPEDLSATVPTDKPEVDDVVIPGAPVEGTDYNLPSVPTLREITIPTAEELTIPVWTETLPTANIASPPYEFTFTEDQYSSAVLTSIQATVTEMLAGGTGLPDAIWQAIIDVAATRNQESGQRSLVEATTDFASRGWASVGGTLAMRLREARQRVQMEDARLLREMAIKQADMEQQNRQFAVTQGIALETMLISAHNAYYERLLRASSLAIELAVQVMNAKIALYNAELTGYQVAATVYKTLVEAELVKLEKFKAEIEAQKLINEVNLADVQLYVAQLEGVQKIIDIFVAQLEGVKAEAEIDKTRMEVFRAEVQAYGEQVNAWAKEWDGYTAAINGQLAKVQLYDASVRAYAADVEAYKAGIEGETAKVNADAVVSNAYNERLRSDTQRYVAEVQGAAAKVDADAKAAQAQASEYSAKAQFYIAKAQALEAQNNAFIANAKAAADIGIAGAKLSSDELIAQMTLAEKAWEAAARIETQIAASAMAAINVSAHISSSGQSSESIDKNYNTDCSA